jgi:hypothetical protein
VNDHFREENRPYAVQKIGVPRCADRPATTYAQSWPSGNISGSTATIARLIQPHLQQRLATAIIIEIHRPNRRGSCVPKAVLHGGKQPS